MWTNARPNEFIREKRMVRQPRQSLYLFVLDEIQELLQCGHEKAVKLLAELDSDRGIGLIERVKRGQGKPTIIYVKQFCEKE